MCFKKRNKPVRLQKKTTFEDKIKPYMNMKIIAFIIFLIIFIFAIKLAIGETSWYNIPNGGV